MQKAIVAIGGGEIRTRGTAPIDRAIIRLSGKKSPKLLFIPTASSDSERYWKHVKEYFGKFLKCKTDVLFLIQERPSKKTDQEEDSVGRHNLRWRRKYLTDDACLEGLGRRQTSEIGLQERDRPLWN